MTEIENCTPHKIDTHGYGKWNVLPKNVSEKERSNILNGTQSRHSTRRTSDATVSDLDNPSGR